MKVHDSPPAATNAARPVYLRPAGLARELGVSLATVTRWRRMGIGPQWVRLSARLIGYRRDAVEAYLASREGLPPNHTAA